MSNRKPDGDTVDELVEDCLNTIDARATEEAIRKLDLEIPLAVGDDKDVMLRDKKALVTNNPKRQSRKWKLN